MTNEPKQTSTSNDLSGGAAVDQLVGLCLEHHALGTDDDGRPFARCGGRLLAIPSPPLRGFLQHAFRSRVGRYPNRRSMSEAMDLLADMAIHEGIDFSPGLRVAREPDSGHAVLDLGSRVDRFVIVSPNGTLVSDTCSVPFVRPARALAMPDPAEGTIEELRPFVNVADERDFRLLVSWLLAALRPEGPYPLLFLMGEQGSAKSTLTELVKTLVDPSSAPTRAAPTNTRDLAIAAGHNHVLALDNVSELRPDISDALCRLATGGGFGTRELYENDQERMFTQQRPVVLNSIVNVVTRQDLIDRTLRIELVRPPAHKTLASLWPAFEAARPGILGALLDGVASADAGFEPARTVSSRMPDHVLWVAAACEAFGWDADELIDDHIANRDASLIATLDGSPLYTRLRALVRASGERKWAGTMTDLLEELGRLPVSRARANLPSNANSLSRQLRRQKPALAAAGVHVTFTSTGRDRSKQRVVTVRLDGVIAADA